MIENGVHEDTEPFGVNSSEKRVWSLMRLLRFFSAKMATV